MQNTTNPDFDQRYSQIRSFINKLIVEVICEKQINVSESIKPIIKIVEQIEAGLTFECGIEKAYLASVNKEFNLELDGSNYVISLMCIPAFYLNLDKANVTLHPSELNLIEQLLIKGRVVSEPEGIYITPQAIHLEQLKRVDIQTQILISGVKGFFNPNAELNDLMDVRDLVETGNDIDNHDLVYPIVLIEKTSQTEGDILKKRINKLAKIEANKRLLTKCITKDEKTLFYCFPLSIKEAVEYLLQTQLRTYLISLCKETGCPEIEFTGYVHEEIESFVICMRGEGTSLTRSRTFKIPSSQVGQGIQKHFDALVNRNTNS
ncbi:hypothetical protein ACNO5E_14245 [Vibrio parahaemolyticus]|uniref:hypothetical protein n=1 Tax=Vibrio parahaemolyticus TaxID=670 RepID=UPI0008138925|nr:hypothetical protein [Vibrio parahaemolyticus]OCP68473.1 hypothetical protein AKH08_16825 [Vibrio parahaemolyticus]